MIADSGKVEACFARHYFRFAYGRDEVYGDDDCSLERVRATLADGGTLKDAFAAIALDPSFKLRRVQ